MSNYEYIQFIGYEISTAPKNAVFENGVIKSGEYVGIGNIDDDIQQRCNLMMNAILTAKDNRTIPADDDKTLKVFMSPEFYFRGPKGAYEMKQVQQVIELLQTMVKDEIWKDWMFVFGSIIGNSRPEQSDWLIQLEEDELFCEVYNVVLVQQGGFQDDPILKENSARIIMKEFMSSIDFILAPTQGISLSQSSHIQPLFPSGDGKEAQIHNYDGLGIFNLNDITFGLEVCLDHLAGRLKNSPQLPGSDMVSFQLIPSCGMDIKPYNAVAQNDGYLFNVDGRTIPSSSLKKVVNDTLAPRPVTGKAFSVPVTDAAPLIKVDVDKIFANSSGSVRIYDLADVPKGQKVVGSYKLLRNSFLYNRQSKHSDKYIFHYQIEYDENKKYKAAYLSVTLNEYKYDIDRVLLPVNGELLNGNVKIAAEVLNITFPNGDDRAISIKFSCLGDTIDGIFQSFKSSIN